MRKQTLKYLYWVLASTVIVLFVVGLAAFRNLQQAQEYGKLVTHTNVVLLQAEETFSLVKDAETGVRGYLLTLDSKFLDPYYTSNKSLQASIERLDSLTVDNPRQRPSVALLRQLADRRLVFMDQSMSISVRTMNRDTLYVLLSQGRLVMDSIRNVMKHIEREEQHLLGERQKKESEFAALTPLWLGLISLLAVSLFSISFFAVIQELRKRWRYESELEQAVDELKKSNEELENFVYVASHHFQEPLRKMQTFSDRLTTKYAPTLQEDAAFLLNRINSAAARMQQLMDDLLTYLHVGHKTQAKDFQSTDLSALLHTFMTDQAEAIAATGGEVNIEANTLPPIQGNAEQLHTLFAQLLDNSLKFVREKIRPIVKIRTFVTNGSNVPGVSKEDAERKFCGIEFSDNGIGFDTAYDDKIFQLFQRLHHIHEYPGTGIGLTICRKVVANHRGYLQVESRIAIGTTFYIYLPILR